MLSSTDKDGNDNYQVAIFPSINKITPPTGTARVIHIKGTGFGNDVSRVKVTANNRECIINSMTNNNLVCKLKA